MTEREEYEKEVSLSLERLETCLETPHVPGELPSWAAAVRKAVADLGPCLKQQISELHHQDFGEISKQDPGLLSRVEQLEAEDAEIADEYQQLTHLVEKIVDSASRIEPDEQRLEPIVEECVERGLSFGLHVRKQETAIKTWLLEAFDRDRGTVD